MTVPESDFDQRVASVRRFNRFYTRQIGVLNEGLLESPYSLTEVRVLYELAHRGQPTASDLGKALGLDAGYLSRILRGFQQRGLIESRPSPADARQNLLCPSGEGREVVGALEARSRDDVGAMLGRLPPADQGRLVGAMHTVERLLGAEPEPAPRAPYLLRQHQSGDMGWIVYRHGVLYAHEYGFDERFEALVAEIVTKFIRELDPARERCWIAEREGEIAGCVFLVKDSAEVAKLRLLLVEPSARGLGIGSRLVDECLRFARRAGYRRITLWTNDSLHAARRIYERAGFQLVDQKPHRSWGPEAVGQSWEREL
jgi:DNA-binding MarR family transcriptional regulator/N-acetylglutamate synthase-like GNAT family acetyltransferase